MRLEALKKWFRIPYYDTRTDTIHNCEPYTFNWFHEDRHRKQFQNKFIKTTGDYCEMFSYNMAIVMPLLMIIWGEYQYIIPIIGLMMLPQVIFLFFIELDAYMMGFWNWIEYKRKGANKK